METYTRTLDCGCKIDIEVAYNYIDGTVEFGDAYLSYVCSDHYKQETDPDDPTHPSTGSPEFLPST